ncbi:MAG: cysteine desulfurase family protein [Bacteroidota bacterium]
MNRRVYMDHTATTPLDPRVLEAMQPYFSEKFGNASSVHQYGQEAKAALELSRDRIAAFIHAKPAEIFFTTGGTESDNFAIKGAALAARAKGRKHIITNRSEHHAVLETCEYLEEIGYAVSYLPVDEYGMVDPDAVRRAVTPGTCLVSIMHANNEVGTINPIEEIAGIAHEHGILFHTDTVQTVGKIPVDVGAMGIDLLGISGHKIYGPKGIGAIYIKKGVEIEKFMHGGGQERGRRAGTENVPLAVGLGKTIELREMEMAEESIRLQTLKERLRRGIEERLEGHIFNGHLTHSLSHILNVSFNRSKIDIDGDVLLLSMDLNGVAVTSGSACTSGSMDPSHVLLAMGRDERTAKATLRFSMGKMNTEEDVEYVLDVLEDVVTKIGKPTSRNHNS